MDNHNVKNVIIWFLIVKLVILLLLKVYYVANVKMIIYYIGMDHVSIKAVFVMRINILTLKVAAHNVEI